MAQKVRGLVTKATVGHWSPRTAAQEIRENITDLRAMMMSQGEHAVDDTYRLAELMQNLQVTVTATASRHLRHDPFDFISAAASVISQPDCEKSIMGEEEGRF